jgi:hypothetical protein
MGALVDMASSNTAIYSRTGDSNGIGFAIPSNMVRVVTESARSGVGHIRMPWIGVRLQEVTPDIAEGLGLAAPSGDLIVSIGVAEQREYRPPPAHRRPASVGVMRAAARAARHRPATRPSRGQGLNLSPAVGAVGRPGG